MSQAFNLDITSANAVAILTVDKLFPAGIELQMFGTDQAVNMENIDITETRKGVDGKMVAGFVPAVYPVTITLEASSPSRAALATLWEAMNLNKTVYPCTLTCTLPSIKAVYTWTNGVLKSGQAFPNMEKTLSPTTCSFDFESFTQARI